MLVSRGRPTFSPLSPAAAAADGQGNPQWTESLMTGGTYIFIFETNGDCLSASHDIRLVLQHCETSARSQRWRRASALVVEDGHDFYQYASLADGKCIAEIPGASGRQVNAGLARCSKAHPASQLLAFWWLTV
jgi:hypothetical protein